MTLHVHSSYKNNPDRKELATVIDKDVSENLILDAWKILFTFFLEICGIKEHGMVEKLVLALDCLSINFYTSISILIKANLNRRRFF